MLPRAIGMGANQITFLVNTALADARDHGAMAKAFAQATEAGRAAYLAGLGPVRDAAEASSPLTGFLAGEDGSGR
jgi:thiazole synthase